MKGKYAARAERRSEFTGLEERAVTAERERDRLAAELAEVRERSEQKIADLRSEAASLRGQRDAVAAPRIAELETANGRLRVQRDVAIAMRQGLFEDWSRMADRLMKTLIKRFGMGGPEAMELAVVLTRPPEVDFRPVSAAGVATKDPRKAQAIQRQRGLRGAGSPAEDVAPELRPVVAIANGREAERKIATQEAVIEDHFSAGRIYAYDADDSSVGFDIWSDRTISICVETSAPDVVADTFLSWVALPATESAKLLEAIASGLVQ